MKSHYILTFAPTGMKPTKEMTPHVPINPQEIVEDVLEGIERGVNMVHLHARDAASGQPTYRKEICAEIISGIRRKNHDVVISVSTSGRRFAELDKRSDMLDLSGEVKPDFASLTLSSLNFEREASINAPDVIQALLGKMLDRDIRPEMAIFDLGMVNYAHYLMRKHHIPKPFFFTVILGNIAGAQTDLMSLGTIVEKLPRDHVRIIGGIGKNQLTSNMLGLITGDGVRIGIEDNIWFDQEGTQKAGNKDFISRITDIASLLGKTPYPPRELREKLRLPAS
ncbi:3-keto-5-aminohexanoate cleavage protein [Candidatus Latescibacterota bacterium]